MNVKGLGIDIVDVKRFNLFQKRKEDRFLNNTFSLYELDYCFSFKDSSVHLAGTFAAKEAVLKSLSRDDIILSNIEIRRDNKGRPEVFLLKKKQKSILVSISHSKVTAVAVAVKQ